MIWVIKLGGSLYADPLLKTWLDMLAELGPGKVVIVPGGGPYAEAVREAQRQWNFPNAIAHHMALLAMEQYGLQLQGIAPALSVSGSAVAIARELAASKVTIWLPAAMALAASDIGATWDVTSDSLAAWLARSLGAQRLILVKSCQVNASHGIVELVRRGIVDLGLEKMLRDVGFSTDVVSKADCESVRERLAVEVSRK